MKGATSQHSGLIAPATLRYIELGPSNAWFDTSIENNRIEFGHPDIPDDLALEGDRTAIAAVHLGKGRDPGKATGYARELLDFYELGEDCLWVTFGQGCMWWAFAKQQVHMLPPTEGGPSRYREVLGLWSNRDQSGALLSVDKLSTRLTRVAAYRQTLCSVRYADALVRRINGLEEPLVIEARAAQQALIGVAETMIRNLHWRDFEILCDMIFARSGWQRIAELGGLQKDTDLVLLHPSTGERAYLQVKSSSDQAELARYVSGFDADPAFSRMFYVCYPPRTTLRANASKPTHVWTGHVTAQQAIAAGPFDWLMQKAG